MLINNTASKYETPYVGPFEITQCWKNGMVTLQCGAIKIGITYVALNHIHLIQMLKILIQKLIVDNVTLGKYLLYTSVLY